MIPNLRAEKRLVPVVERRLRQERGLRRGNAPRNRRGAPRAPIRTGCETLSSVPPRTAVAGREGAKCLGFGSCAYLVLLSNTKYRGWIMVVKPAFWAATSQGREVAHPLLFLIRWAVWCGHSSYGWTAGLCKHADRSVRATRWSPRTRILRAARGRNFFYSPLAQSHSLLV